MMTAFNLTSPARTDYFSQIFLVLRSNRVQFKERFELDHYIEDSTNVKNPATDPDADGMHKKITMKPYLEYDSLLNPIYEPSLLNGSGVIFVKNVNGVNKLYFKNSKVLQVLI